jgi:tetratricopeptide (TPR) repeat protein
VTRFLLVVAGIALSSNAAIALDCMSFFTASDVQRSCFRFVGLIGETRGGVRTTCAVLKAAFELQQHSQGATTYGKKDLEACLREFPDPPAPTPPPPTAYMRGLAALDGGDFEAAIAEFTAAIADDPKDTFSYIRRGTAYEKKGDAASAIGDYRKVLKLVDADTGAEYAAKIRKLEKTK